MNYSALLHAISYDRLRAIAATLHLRKHVDGRQQWIDAIHQLWHSPVQQAQWLSTLSLPACRALWRLLEAPRLPARLYFADFGALEVAERRGTAAERKQASTKKKPGARLPSPAQELYDLGLLFSSEDSALDRSQWVTIADDLRQPIAAWLHQQLARWQRPVAPVGTAAPFTFSPTPFVLLHDLIHLLAFARQSPTGLRVGKRFPYQTDWQWLHPGLLALHDAAFAEDFVEDFAKDFAKDTARRGSEWLRFLLLLAEAAGLLVNGTVQPLLWHWVQLPVAEQMQLLWQGWLAAPPQLCQRFERLALADVSGWQVALAALQDEDRPCFSAADLTHRLITQASQLPLAWLYRFPSLQALDQHLEALLAALRLWGVVEEVGQQAMPFVRPLDEESGLEIADSLPESTYRLLRLGVWLLTTHPDHATQSVWGGSLEWGEEWRQNWKMGRGQWLASRFSAAPVSAFAVQSDGDEVGSSALWDLLQQSDGDPESLLRLAPFCATIRLEPSARLAAKVAMPDGQLGAQVGEQMAEGRAADVLLPSRWVHHLQISGQSLALAASRGYHAADIWQFVQQSGLQLQPGDWQQLQRWLQAGSELRLQPALLLRSDSAGLMRRIQQNRQLRDQLGAMLTPTVAIWQGEADKWAEELRAQGFFPVTTSSLSATGEAADEEGAEEAFAGSSQDLDKQLVLNGEDAAVLWLALQLYDAVGKFAALPLRATAETVRQLFASLSLSQQAALAAQSSRLEDALKSALDQLPFAPARQPSDPERWRSLIDQAIAEGIDLEIVHWSAGRNLEVKRRVTPFYIDDASFGGPACRGWCHYSGHDLWFRLDRILDLALAHP